jgi:flavin-dependent dehydrogenase
MRHSSTGFDETAVPLANANRAFSSAMVPPSREMKTSPVSCEMYSALIPSLRVRTLRNNRIQGQGWALLGDAAGFADPITCEGIYYALRSGELLAHALTLSRPDSYSRNCDEDFVEDFIHAAELFEKFYTGRFLGSDFITRVVQTTSRSKILQTLMNSFIAGKQDYKSVRSKLLRKLPRICLQVMRSAFIE